MEIWSQNDPIQLHCVALVEHPIFQHDVGRLSLCLNLQRVQENPLLKLNKSLPVTVVVTVFVAAVVVVCFFVSFFLSLLLFYFVLFYFVLFCFLKEPMLFFLNQMFA